MRDPHGGSLISLGTISRELLPSRKNPQSAAAMLGVALSPSLGMAGRNPPAAAVFAAAVAGAGVTRPGAVGAAGVAAVAARLAVVSSIAGVAIAPAVRILPGGPLMAIPSVGGGAGQSDRGISPSFGAVRPELCGQGGTGQGNGGIAPSLGAREGGCGDQTDDDEGGQEKQYPFLHSIHLPSDRGAKCGRSGSRQLNTRTPSMRRTQKALASSQEYV